MTRKNRIYAAVVAAALAVPVIAIAGSANLWPGTAVDQPEPQMSGVPTALRNNLANFDDLDFRVYTQQQWQDVHLSHSDDVVVHWPDGHMTQGLAKHIEDMKGMFTFAPNTAIKEHPVRFGTNDAEWTAVTSWLEGDFTLPMVRPDGVIIPPTGKHFRVPMVTLGHWNADGKMDEEYLMWDNYYFYSQLGLLPSSGS